MQEGYSVTASDLIPGVSEQTSRLAAASAQPAPMTELQRFLHRVICDGRFIEEVSTDPQRVAEELEFDLSRETADQVKSKELREHVGDLCETRFEALGPIAIVIIVAAIIIIIAITISRYSDRSKAAVQDFSKQKESKL